MRLDVSRACIITHAPAWLRAGRGALECPDADVHFVAFHVEPSAAATERIAASCASFRAETDYRRLLTILFRSVHLFHPGARCAVLTDGGTPFDDLPQGVRVHRSVIDSDSVMYSRLVAQIDYLRNHAGNEAVAFLDSDMILNGPLWPQQGQEFDVALTYRDSPEMPVNGGVILVQAGAQQAAIAFLERVREIYASRFSDAQHWWGDQQALIAAIGRERYARRDSDLLTLDVARIRLLPCDTHNFSPAKRISAIASELHGKTILHFKGERKRLMPLYWNAHLSNRSDVTGSASNASRWPQRALRWRGYWERVWAFGWSAIRLPRRVIGRFARRLRSRAG